MTSDHAHVYISTRTCMQPTNDKQITTATTTSTETRMNGASLRRGCVTMAFSPRMYDGWFSFRVSIMCIGSRTYLESSRSTTCLKVGCLCACNQFPSTSSVLHESTYVCMAQEDTYAHQTCIRINTYHRHLRAPLCSVEWSAKWSQTVPLLDCHCGLWFSGWWKQTRGDVTHYELSAYNLYTVYMDTVGLLLHVEKNQFSCLLSPHHLCGRFLCVITFVCARGLPDPPSLPSQFLSSLSFKSMLNVHLSFCIVTCSGGNVF